MEASKAEWFKWLKNIIVNNIIITITILTTIIAIITDFSLKIKHFEWCTEAKVFQDKGNLRYSKFRYGKLK